MRVRSLSLTALGGSVLSLCFAGLASGPRADLWAQGSGSNDLDQLDREFYNEYLDSIPDDWRPDKKLLEQNLFDTLKRVLPREDPFDGPEYIKKIQPDQLEYKRITTDSPFVRGLFKEAPYLKQTKYMWIVKSGPYLVFISYEADPERYTLSEFQNLVIKRSDDQDSSEHKDNQ